MSNLKISQLPSFTGSTNGSWLIANNSAESETFKIQRETFLNGYALTTDVTALSSSIATTDLGQNNRLNSIEGVTGSYATTGSNTFIGTETISGSVLIQGTGNSLEVNGGNVRVSGSVSINASSPSATKFLFFNNNSGSAGTTVSYSPLSNGTFSIFQSGSGTINIGSVSGNNNINGRTQLTGSFSVTGSLIASGSAAVNRIYGNSFVATATGGSSLNAFDVDANGLGNYLTVAGATGANTLTAPNTDISSSVKTRLIGPTTEVSSSLTVSGSAHKIVGNTTITGSLGTTGSITTQRNISAGNSSLSSGQISLISSQSAVITTVATGSAYDVELIMQSLPTGSRITDWNTSTSLYETKSIIYVDANTGTAPVPHLQRGAIVSGSLGVTGSVNITGSISNLGSYTQNGTVITTGSVQGNIVPLTVSFSTASMNLDNGNFFTLQLVSGSSVHLNPSNIKPGQTVNVLVNTIGSGSITFPSTVRQTSGSLYIPTYATGQDILTMVSFDSSSLYLANAKNFL